jgi:MFS family permease
MMIGMSEASQGIGALVGPIVGTGLFAVAGYNFMLYSLGCLFIVMSIVVYVLFPAFVDSTHEGKKHATSALDMNISGAFSYQRRLSID